MKRQRFASAMTAADLVAWKNRHRLTVAAAATILGISRQSFRRSVKNNRVTQPSANICAMFDQLDDHAAVKAITIRQLAKIAARNGK